MIDYTIYPVHPALKRFVNGICIMQETVSATTLLTANTDATLIFYLGTQQSPISYDFLNLDKNYTFNNQDLWLGGMHSEPINCQIEANTQVLCTIFSPVGVQYLVRDNVTCVLNNGFSFDALGLNKKFDGLIELLSDVKNNNEALQIAESYLLKFFSPIDIPFSIKDMTPVSDYIKRQQGRVTIKQLEEKFRISRRWLEKQFAAQIGMSPKEFARIIRFKALLAQVMSISARSNQDDAPTVNWANMIEDYGYYDHSHLTRDFYNFTGQTPTQYFQNAHTAVNTFFYSFDE